MPTTSYLVPSAGRPYPYKYAPVTVQCFRQRSCPHRELTAPLSSTNTTLSKHNFNSTPDLCLPCSFILYLECLFATIQITPLWDILSTRVSPAPPSAFQISRDLFLSFTDDLDRVVVSPLLLQAPGLAINFVPLQTIYRTPGATLNISVKSGAVAMSKDVQYCPRTT